MFLHMWLEHALQIEMTSYDSHTPIREDVVRPVTCVQFCLLMCLLTFCPSNTKKQFNVAFMLCSLTFTQSLHIIWMVKKIRMNERISMSGRRTLLFTLEYWIPILLFFFFKIGNLYSLTMKREKEIEAQRMKIVRNPCKLNAILSCGASFMILFHTWTEK